MSGGDVDENLAVLRSREFIWRFIRDQNLLPVLFEDKCSLSPGTIRLAWCAYPLSGKMQRSRLSGRTRPFRF